MPSLLTPMRSRAYARSLLAAGTIVFLLTVGANVLIDPQAVFGTGRFTPILNRNDRFLSFETYRRDPLKYEGYLFASSRGHSFATEPLAPVLGAREVMKFSVYGGQVYDHLQLLEHLLERERHREATVRSIFLLLDVDDLGEEWVNGRSLQTTPHPEITREGRVRFIWRYLTAIQPKAWRTQLAYWSAHAGGRYSMPRQLSPRLVSAAHAQQGSANNAAKSTGLKITTRRRFSEHLEVLAKFVQICRLNRIDLTIAMSPLHVSNAQRFDPQDLDRAVEAVARMTPVWYFGAPEWLSAREDLWYDRSHFKPEVAEMIVARIFNRSSPISSFGIMLTPTAPSPRTTLKTDSQAQPLN
jgi:hypothetical protein